MLHTFPRPFEATKSERRAGAYLLFLLGAVLACPNVVFGQILTTLPASEGGNTTSQSSLSLTFWGIDRPLERGIPASASGGTPTTTPVPPAGASTYSSSSWDLDVAPEVGDPDSAGGETSARTRDGLVSPTTRRAPGSAGGGSPVTATPPSAGAGTEGDNFALEAHYRYNGGGGYTCIASPQTDFSLNIQNQFTVDGTFADRNVPTTYQGLTIPFYRTYLFGNITKNIDYQGAVQGFLGGFNVLDLWVNGRYDDRLNFRVGRMLSPFLYEYYGFSPAWEPVINNSLLFQIAGKRQQGAMLWGKLFNNKLQYQGGVFNGVSGSFFGIGRNVSFLGAFTATPFKGESQLFDSLGFGMGVQAGRQDYLLNAGNNLNFVNGAGEPTLNNQFVTTTGVPFFQYADNVAANGNQTKFAPHLFWFGRFTLLGEYVWMDRTLTNGTTTGVSVTQGWYMNASYFLTGERRTADGLGGYTTVTPLSPFVPTKGRWGWGAWEAAFQYSQLHLDNNDFARGFASSNNWANRCDQIMVGMNWWPNKYTRWSFDWMYNTFNRPIPLVNVMASNLNTYWTRLAVFF